MFTGFSRQTINRELYLPILFSMHNRENYILLDFISFSGCNCMFVCVYVCRVRVIKLFTFENEKMIYDDQMEKNYQHKWVKFQSSNSKIYCIWIATKWSILKNCIFRITTCWLTMTVASMFPVLQSRCDRSLCVLRKIWKMPTITSN